MARSIIRDGRLADGRRVDVHVEDGHIVAVLTAGSTLLDDEEAATDPTADDAAGAHDPVEIVELEGWLLLPALAEPHAHLDKALTAERVPNPTGDLAGAIAAWVRAAEAGMFTHDDMVSRIRRALEALLVNGVTAVRSHINTGAGAGIAHLIAAREAAAPFSEVMDIEFVALTHSPIAGDEGEVNRRSLTDALEEGVHLVGGCPHLEPDGAAAIDIALRVAGEGGVRVDLHVDETLDPRMLTLRELARQVVDRGVEGQVAASHCVSLGMQPPDVQAAVAHEVATAGIAVIPLPQTNLFLQGRDDRTATPRGLTAVGALVEAGALVAAGADNVQDPFNLVGRSDPLETAALLVMAAHVLPDEAYEMVSNNVRLALGLAPVRFEVGDPADFLAIDAPSIRAAIADAPMNRKVVKAGRLVASSVTSRTVHVG